PQPRLSQLMSEIMERVSRLDMRRISAGHGAAQSKLGPMSVDPTPGRVGITLSAGDVDGTAVAVAAAGIAAAVLGIAAMRLEACRDTLAIVVAKRAQHRPSDSVRIHGVAGVVKLLAEIGVHAAYYVSLQRHAQPLCGRRVFPGEVAGRIRLDGLALVNLPQ